MRQELLNIPLKPDKYKKGHIEKDFQGDVFTSLRKLGWYSFHVPDIWYSTKLLDGIIVTTTGSIFLIEFKKTDGYTFNMSQFEPSQIFFLEYCMNVWAEAYVMVYSQKTQPYWGGDYKYLKENQNGVGGVKLFTK